MSSQRPINLDLASLKFPPMAIASILHRISGVLLFILLPLVLYMLSLSLQSTNSFNELKDFLLHPHIKLAVWVFISALSYHVLAGIRHIILDMGVGEDVGTAKLSAVAVIVLAIVMTCLLGMWIW